VRHRRRRILRDIFAVGARPIAVLDSLRYWRARLAAFALPARPGVAGNWALRQLRRRRNRGGEVYFEGPYEQNCLVNAMAWASAPHDAPDAAAAGRRRQPRRAAGRADRARRDRRGLVLASAELGDGDEAKRPSARSSDPSR